MTRQLRPRLQAIDVASREESEKRGLTMPQIKFTGLLFVGLLVVAASARPLTAQSEGAAQKQGQELKQVPITYSDPGSGAQMYKDYCAACHGIVGRGNGPAAEFLKAPPPDLTTMAQRNDGKYPSSRVTSTLRFGTGTGAHGNVDMPIWGPLFRTQHQLDGDAVVKQRIANLVDFIGSLQQK
jgi:mono/diheme cytochrome c family protein